MPATAALGLERGTPPERIFSFPFLNLARARENPTAAQAALRTLVPTSGLQTHTICALARGLRYLAADTRRRRP